MKKIRHFLSKHLRGLRKSLPGLLTNALFWVLFGIVVIIALPLFFGTLIAIWKVGDVAEHLLDDSEQLRWYVLGYVGLITALGGIFAAPLTLWRLRLIGRQTKATEDGLTTERLTKAVLALGADKDVKRFTSKNETPQTIEETVPNLEVRNGAILALERISEDTPDYHIQIMEILTAYIRENAGGVPQPRMEGEDELA